MITLIKNNISWDKLPAKKAADYVINIVRAIAVKGEKSIELSFELNFIIPYEDLENIQHTITNELPGSEFIRLKFVYKDMILSTDEILKLFIPYMIAELEKDFAPLAKTIFKDDCEFSEDILTVYSLGETTAELLNKKPSKIFSGMLLHSFGIKAAIIFKNKPDAYKEKTDEFRQNSIEEMKQLNDDSAKTARLNAASNLEKKPYSPEKKYVPRSKTYEGPIVGNRLFGKPMKQESTVSLSSLNINTKKAVIEGMVFKKEIVTTKNNNKKILIMITDFSDSVCLRSFPSAKKATEIDENLKVGDHIRAQGDAEFDTFENSLVFDPKSLEKIEYIKREDKSTLKRVELHAHTKMSRTDGFNEIKDLIYTTAEWGHKAVAITDHGVVLAFPDAAKYAKEKNIKVLYGVEAYLVNEGRNGTADKIDYKSNHSRHIILLAATQEGMKNLYKLISTSHIDYFYKTPRMPKSIIEKHREGLLIGSACQDGEVYQAILNDLSEEEIIETIKFYDYLEIQPRSNNMFLVREGKLPDEEAVLNINRKILEYGKLLGMPIAATCDSHYTNQEDHVYRKIIMAGHGYKDLENEPSLYLRTTDEMLEEFSYLGKDDAEYVVIDCPNRIADMIGNVQPIPEDRFPPEIPGSEERLRSNCYKKAASIYGDPLPEPVLARLDRELNSIINNGYAVMYVAAELLVQKSLSDGYLVGSRGSVGSSFAATMGGITEVNPLTPHYICPKCKNFENDDSGEYDCGIDMPDKICPLCGTPFNKDGFNIPFEVFLGYEGDKEPDIDLNFAGEYQQIAHKYVEEIFGKENVFRAGTITSIQEKTAFGYVRKYFDERGEIVNRYEAERLAIGCSGVRKSTGQHPGGIVIVPRGHEIYEFCPIQLAADGRKDIITTHFDFHSIDKNLLKLDILGHDVPSMIRMLQDLTGLSPEDVPLRDKKVDSLFIGTDGLDILDQNYMFSHGTFGIPEFGTKFTRQMLDDTRPSTFADLVRIAGFSHGTDVWLNNAQNLIRSGTTTIKNAISTRDDIMNYLIKKGVPAQTSFKIMESVRKGKGITPEWEEDMKSNDVPEWYIESCKKIKYMFPKAHAVAYVMMSYRIAYYKVYHPLAFYAVYFTMNVDGFDAKTALRGKDAIRKKLEMIENKGKEASDKELKEMQVFEVAYEMYCRGYEFQGVILELSDAVNFTLHEGKILLPFRALEGIGETASRSLARAVKKGGFLSVEDLRNRAKLNKKSIEALEANGVLEGLPEFNQLTLF